MLTAENMPRTDTALRNRAGGFGTGANWKVMYLFSPSKNSKKETDSEERGGGGGGGGEVEEAEEDGFQEIVCIRDWWNNWRVHGAADKSPQPPTEAEET